MTEDGQALVMLKNGTIGITGLMQGCPNGVQTLLGSRISINGNLIPTSQMCNQQTGFRAVEVEIGQAPEMVRNLSHHLPVFPRNRRPLLIKTPSCRLPGRHTPGNMTRKQQKPLILALTK